jgi:hypothetical protein
MPESPLIKPKARRVPAMTRLFLYVHAGGRCEFDGCNAYLLEHHVTSASGNFAEMAHIWAFSDAGPRPNAQQDDVHASENLMLLCPKCHKLIDDRPDEYKQRLKTNLQTHIDHIRDSGVTDAIRLMKLWKVRNGLSIKTFVLELLVIELLARRRGAGLSDQMLHVWTQMRDDPDSLRAEDPANPTGNDLTPLLVQVRGELEMVARTTLATIDSHGWEAVFGELEGNEESASSAVRVLTAAAARTTNPTRPWLSGE